MTSASYELSTTSCSPRSSAASSLRSARALAAAPARLAFVRVDLADDASLDAALADGGGFDLVVHTAGPFQVGRRAPSLSLRPALENVRACPL